MRVEKTLPVIFRMYRGELCAYFPTEEWDFSGIMITCYAHVGQHGGASRLWLQKGRLATPAEYADLLAELRGIYENGEDAVILKVYKRNPTRHNRGI